MKKTLLVLTILYAHIALAQNVNFGLRAGITSSLLIEKYNGTTSTKGNVNNADIGAYADIKFGNFTVQPGLAYFLKGGGGGTAFSYSYSSGSITFYDQMIRLHYLEIPVNAIYNFPIKAGKFFVGAGPYIAVAVAAKSEVLTTTGSGSTSSTTDIPFGDGASDIKRIDYGLNVLGGFRFNSGLELGLAYGFGLQNLVNQPNYSIKNATGSITVGYFFK